MANISKIKTIDGTVYDIKDALTRNLITCNTVSGAIASFDAIMPNKKIKKVQVNIKPVQDIHGYDHPWPAGGGKNLIPFNTQTITESGITFTPNSDGTITVNGTASANANYFFIGSANEYVTHDIPAGDYILSGGSSNVYLYVTAQGKSVIADQGTPKDVTIEDGDLLRVFIRVVSGKTVSNLVVKPMLRRVTDTDDTFAPYSNICPISGWTGATVARTGKNLLNENVMIAGTNFDDNGVIIMNSSYRTLQEYIPVTPSTTYSLQMTKNIYGTRGFNVCFYDADKQFISRNKYILSSSAGLLTGTFTTTADTSFIRCGAPVSPDASNLMIEAGSIATDFEPFGNTYPITFPTEAGTVYCGTLDVTGGKMVVDMAIVDLGTLTWMASTTSEAGKNRFIADVPGFAVGTTAYAICSEYKRISSTYDYGVTGFSPHGTLARILVADITRAEMTGAEFKTAMSGVQLCYELAAPVEIPLTPTEITTLLGTNNIWADCGDVTVTYGAYLETLKASLDRTNGELDTLRACIAPIEDGATASQAYAAGAYFFRNGIFCTALIPIQSGGQFTIGTNYQTTTVAAALIALQS